MFTKTFDSSRADSTILKSLSNDGTGCLPTGGFSPSEVSKRWHVLLTSLSDFAALETVYELMLDLRWRI